MAPINPPTYQQAGTYSARLDRLMVAGAMMPEHGTGALAMRGGVRPTPSNTGLQVTQRASPAMFTTIAAGTGFVPASSAVGGGYIVHNDASFDVAIAAAHATLGRRDLVIAQVRDAEYSGANNDWLLSVVTGTASGSPTLPATPAGAIPLAQVQVNANASTITNANITDLRNFTVALGGTIPAASTARPANPYEGMSIYETNNNLPKWYNGSAWSGWQDEGYMTPSDLATYLAANGYVTTSYLTSNAYVTQTGLDASTWTSYTPNWGASTSNPSIGNGNIAGRYYKIGKWCHVHIGLDIGSTTSIGSGAYSFSLPFTPATFLTGGFLWSSGVCIMNNSGGSPAQIPCWSYILTIGGIQRVRMMTSNGADVEHNIPFTWGTGDDLDINITYQTT